MKRKRKERVACYIRVSSEEQRLHGISLDAQEDKLRTYAEQHDLEIVAWYRDEGVSGRKLIKNRPQLQQMIKDKANFDRILFIKLDRFFRSVAEYHEAMKLLDPVIWTATEEKYDLSNANGRAFVNMKLTIAELEADQTGERIKLVNDYKVKQGLALTGSTPLGYMVVKTPEGRKVVKNKDESEQIMWLFDTYSMTQSLRVTAIKFEEHWGVTMGVKTVSRIIKNTLYYGSYRGNDCYCEPYITKDEWDRLNSFAKAPVRHSKHTYFFTGLIRCPHCGFRLSARRNNYDMIYYGCKRYIARHCEYKGAVSEIALERMLLDNIEYHVNQAKQYTVTFEKKHTRNTANYEAELGRLNYSWQKGRISVDDYDAEYNRLIELINQQKSTSNQVDFDSIERLFSGDWRNIYESLDREHKRSFWHSFIKEIHVTWESNGIKRIDEVIFF